MLPWWHCRELIHVLVRRCPVPYNIRCVYMLIYVSRCVVLLCNISYVVLTTYIVCTSRSLVWRNYISSCFLPSRPCLYRNRMCITSVLNVLTLGDERVAEAARGAKVAVPRERRRVSAADVRYAWILARLNVFPVSSCFSRIVSRMLLTATVHLSVYIHIYPLLSTRIRSNYVSMPITLLWLLFTSKYVRTSGPVPHIQHSLCVLPLCMENITPIPSCHPSHVWIAIEWRSKVDAELMTLLTAYIYPSVYAVKCWCCVYDAVVSAHLRKMVTCTVQLWLCVPQLGVEILPTLMLVAVQAVFT